METSENVVINTTVHHNELMDIFEVESTLIARNNTNVSGEYFRDNEDEIKTLNEHKLENFIKRSLNKELIEKYSDKFSGIITESNMVIDDIPLGINIRDRIDQTVLNLLFDLGFNPKLINDIRRQFKF